ncbi:hypothetical protein U1Q18_017921 [Sarracenia purpurea var. burkii]
MNKYQAKRAFRTPAMDKKTNQSGDKIRASPNRFLPLFPGTNDYEEVFPHFSRSTKSQKDPHPPDQLFMDVAEVKDSLLSLIRDFPLDHRSRRTVFAEVKCLDEEVNLAKVSSASRMSLETHEEDSEEIKDAEDGSKSEQGILQSPGTGHLEGLPKVAHQVFGEMGDDRMVVDKEDGGSDPVSDEDGTDFVFSEEKCEKDDEVRTEEEEKGISDAALHDQPEQVGSVATEGLCDPQPGVEGFPKILKDLAEVQIEQTVEKSWANIVACCFRGVFFFFFG